MCWEGVWVGVLGGVWVGVLGGVWVGVLGGGVGRCAGRGGG